LPCLMSLRTISKNFSMDSEGELFLRNSVVRYKIGIII
jgi:hypothetical protein